MDEMNLSENGSAPQTSPAPLPPEKSAPKTDPAFLALGVLAPIVLGSVVTWLATFLGSLANGAFSFLYAIGGAVEPALFVACLVSFFVGRQRGNVRLKSFGQGGLIVFAVIALLGLLAFGTCMVTGVIGG